MSEPARAALISIVGGESTGKSTLAAALEARLPAVVVPEFLRTWVDAHAGRVPRPDEQHGVLAGHREAELAALSQADELGRPWAVSDSGPLMTAVYSIQCYDDSSLLPVALESTAASALVVWCQDDIPWAADPQRDSPTARATSQQILAAIFAEQPGLPLLPVGGSLADRVEAVLRRTRTLR